MAKIERVKRIYSKLDRKHPKITKDVVAEVRTDLRRSR